MERSFVMLTFDLEEFDIPEEFGQKVSAVDQMRVTLDGTSQVLPVLNSHDIPATFFTTGHFAHENPYLIKSLAARHEIASHAYYHAHNHNFQESDILKSKQVLEELSGQTVTGFRMPRLRPFDKNCLTEWGFRYDSSINPTWLPGRYNLLHESKLPTFQNGLIELPCSVTPQFRIPLFWLAFKNFPEFIYAQLCKRTVRRHGNLMLYFHPWEFADLRPWQLPYYVKAKDHIALTDRLDLLIRRLKKVKHLEFVTCNDFCDQHFGKK